MKFMWESFDDVLQAEMQGDNRFTDFVGRFRLWAVWPPLVTSDGKWPSQNSGEARYVCWVIIAEIPNAYQAFCTIALQLSPLAVVLK